MESLTYDQARIIIQDGDIVLFQGDKSFKHPLDSLIMWATGSPFVHVNIAFWVEIGGQQRLMGVEAQGGTERRIINESYYQGRLMCVVKGVKDWNTIAPDALSKLAVQKYGYLTAIYAGTRDYFVRAFGWKLPKMNHPGEICSEFVARMQGLTNTDVSPGDLYTELLAISSERTLP